MKKYLLSLTLAAAFGCNDNQLTPDNPFNNLEDAFVNFDKDVGVTDAALADHNLLLDTSLIDSALPQDASPDAESNFGEERNLEELFHIRGAVAAAPHGHLRQIDNTFFYTTNREGRPRIISFTQSEILTDSTLEQLFPATVTDITPVPQINEVVGAYSIVGSTFSQGNNDPFFAYLGNQLNLSSPDAFGIRESPSQDYFTSVTHNPNTLYFIEAGTEQGRAQLCWRDPFVEERECRILGEGIVHDIEHLAGVGTFAVGNAQGHNGQNQTVWFIDTEKRIQLRPEFPETSLKGLDFNEIRGLCVAGKQGNQGYVAMLDATSLEVIWEHQFAGAVNDVAGSQEGCVVAGNIDYKYPLAHFTQDGAKWHSASLESTLTTSVLSTPRSYLVAIHAGNPIEVSIYKVSK